MKRFDFKAGPVRKRVWSAGRFFVLASLLGLTFGVFFLASLRVATRAREVEVPDLTGRSVAEAQKLLAASGLVLRVDETRRPDPKVPADHILTQEPDAGSVLRAQRAVRVRVSDGQRAPVVPAVANLPERTADVALEADKIAVGIRAEIRSAAYNPGLVVAQDPAPPGRAAAVNLLVNRGERSASYVMPDLIGTLGVRTADILRRQGFRVAEASAVPYPGLPPGVVVRQAPQAGYQISFGETITIEVSR